MQGEKTMKIFAVNGSPRKSKNTATLLKKALEGARAALPEAHVETEIIHLYDLHFTGCKSCFACKLIDGKSYGTCAVKDDLTDILDKLSRADGIIFGTPVYFAGITGEMRSFLERLLFQYYTYDNDYHSLAPKKMPTAFIYTMNVTEKAMHSLGYIGTFESMEAFVAKVFSQPEVLYANDTYQFDDYSKYKMERFSEEAKARQRERQFPIDCRKAFDMGKALLAKSSSK